MYRQREGDSHVRVNSNDWLLFPLFRKALAIATLPYPVNGVTNPFVSCFYSDPYLVLAGTGPIPLSSWQVLLLSGLHACECESGTACVVICIRLTVNPSTPSFSGARIEEFLYEKLDKKVPSRITNGEILGHYMHEAARDFGAGSPYGE